MPRWPALRRKVRTARRQPWAVLCLVPLAWTAIGLAAAIIVLRPFRRIAPWLGTDHGAVLRVSLATPAQLARARTIGVALGIAADNAPFRSNCLPQAMAAIALCRWWRIPYAMHLGAAVLQEGAERKLAAHAWVECGRVTITGSRGGIAQYAVVACFCSP